MSGAKAKAISEINLEEFERRLRASATPQGVEDPLAELTRLVDTIAAERPASDNVLSLPASRLPKAEPYSPPSTRRAEPSRRVEPAPLVAMAPPVSAPAAPLQIDEAPLLRAAIEEPDDAPPFDETSFEPPHFDVSDGPHGETEAGVPIQAAPPPRRSRGWTLKVGGLVAAAAVMASAAVVFKVGLPRASKTPPMILAASTPTKVAPPSEAAVQSPNDSGALLQKDTAQPTPVAPKLMSTTEQPIDLTAQPTPQATAAANLVASNDASPVAPMPASPIVPPADPGAPAVSPLASQGQRVKTISVRPDGTLITSSYESASAASEPAAATPAAPKKADVSAAAEPASPTVALPTKLAPPKSSARVVAKTETTAPAEATEAAPPSAPAHVRKPKPPKDAAVADAQPTADAPPSSVHWAVQLGAPGSEAEAQSMISRLKGKYSDALDGAALGVHKADRNGETIYRVRAGGLSKSAAAELCAKVKAAGGDCFLAKN